MEAAARADGPEQNASSGWIARLYELVNKDQWVQVATGTLRLIDGPQKALFSMILIADEESVEFSIVDSVHYQVEDESLLKWEEPSTGRQMTLSFTDPKFCNAFSHHLDVIQEMLRGDLRLPAPNVGNLERIAASIASVEPSMKQALGNSLLRDFYLDDLFDLAGQLESDDHLEYMFEIFLNIVSLGHSTLLEYVTGIQWLPDLIYILSHDPKIPRRRRVDHRAFLCEKAKFKEVVPFPNAEVIQLIHHSFMLQYLRDTVVIGILDDMSLSALTALVLDTNLAIFHVLQRDPQFDADVMKTIQVCSDVEKLRDLATFLGQYFDLSKGIVDLRKRHNFFGKLASCGLFDALLTLLSFPDEKVQLTTVGLLLTAVMAIPIMMREYIISDAQRESEYSFGESLVEGFHTAAGSGEMGQFTEVFRHLLDPYTMEEHRQATASASEALDGTEEDELDNSEKKTEMFVWEGKEAFLRLFYQKFLPQIIAPVVETAHEGSISHMVWTLKSEIADLMTFCVGRHGLRIRSFVLSHQVLEHLVRLLPRAPGTLALAIIRFFRAAVGLSDRYLDQRIVQKKLFEPVLEIFRANARRYNMINSALLELFSFISEDGYRNFSLLKYLVENYRYDFEEADYAPCFKELITKHEAREDYLENGSRRSSGGQKRVHSDAFPEEDDDYFDTLSDGEESTPPLEGLCSVDGEEEDDAEALHSPPPPLKRRRRDDDDGDDDDGDPFKATSQASGPVKKAFSGKNGAITFSLTKKVSDSAAAAAQVAEASTAKEAPSAAQSSDDEEPASAPSPLLGTPL